MKPPYPSRFVPLRLLSQPAACGHTRSRTHLQPNAPRSVAVSEAATPPVIRAGLLQSTLIMLPAEEKVATVFGGDTVDWVFDGGHVASRFISIKPKLAKTTRTCTSSPTTATNTPCSSSESVRRRGPALRFQSLHHRRATRQGRTSSPDAGVRSGSRAGQGQAGGRLSQS